MTEPHPQFAATFGKLIDHDQLDTAICVETVGANQVSGVHDPEGLPLIGVYIDGHMFGSHAPGFPPMAGSTVLLLRGRDMGALIGNLMAAAERAGIIGTVQDWANRAYHFVVDNSEDVPK